MVSSSLANDPGWTERNRLKTDYEELEPKRRARHIVRKVVLRYGPNELIVDAMIDSGSDVSLITPEAAEELGVPTVPLKTAINIRGFDDKGASSLDRATPYLSMEVEGRTNASRFLLSKCAWPVLLGMDWAAANKVKLDCAEETLIWPEGDGLRRPAPLAVELLTAEQFQAALQEPGVCAGVLSYCEEDGTVSAVRTDDEFGDEEASAEDLAQIPEEYREFVDLFLRNKADRMPDHSRFDHHIPLEDGKHPPYGPLYGMNPVELEAMRAYLEENLARGFIRKSTSPAGAPVLFVKKKDGSLRLCVDYRGLNAVTIKDRTPLPLIKETLDSIKGAQVFTSLDLRGAYNLVRVQEGEEWKTAFRTRYGLFEYCVMPFGLTNAPATFQAMINEVLRPYIDVFCAVYLDDILIYSRRSADHSEHVRTVLRTLQAHNLFVKAEKCKWGVTEVEFLGYVLTPQGARMEESKLDAIREWPRPKNVREVLSFLGYANFYRDFVGYYSKQAKELYALTKKDCTWEWGPPQESAFLRLKQSFLEAPILRHFDVTREARVETDASCGVIGGILSQEMEDGKWHPCAYFCRQMIPAERNYPVYDQELLAIVKCLEAWRVHLEGRQELTTVLTDHHNLKYWTTSRNVSGRHGRWHQVLSRYNIKIEYRAGCANRADAISRRTDLMPDGQERRSLIMLRPEQLEGFPEAEPEPDGLRVAAAATTLPTGPMPQGAEECRRILEHFHDNEMAGHPGVKRTLAAVRRAYQWDGMVEYVRRYVKACAKCQRTKAPRRKPFGLLAPLPIPDRPFASVSMDYIVKLPESDGHDSILVMVDRLTKMAIFVPCREDISAVQLSTYFLDHVVAHHGVPREVVSDRGPHFRSKFWTAFQKALGVKVKLSTAYHPETDGQTERANQTLEDYLRSYTNDVQDDWAARLPMAMFAYNNAVCESTQMSPFYANKGFNPSTGAGEDAAGEGRSGLDSVLARLKENLVAAQKRHAMQANKHRSPPPFDVGDLVLLSSKHLNLKQNSQKLGPRFVGPFRILRNFNDRSFELDLPKSMRIHRIFHARLLKPFEEDDIEGRYRSPPDSVEIDGQEEYEVEEIVARRLRRGKTQYLVKWAGYGVEEKSWEPVGNLAHAQDLVKEFEERETRKLRLP